MQTLIGFWAFQVPSNYISRTTTVFCADDGFGNLIALSSRNFPVYAIETANQ
jgi:hypothetical protein